MSEKRNVPGSPDWVRECPHRHMVGLHVSDYDQVPEYAALVTQGKAAPILSNIDPKHLARELRKAGVQAFWFYNKCHKGNSYYPSKVPGAHIHSALNGRDLFGEICEACLSEGIVPLCVYEFSDHRIIADKPEWCHHKPPVDGDFDMTDGMQGSRISGACLHGPYGEYALEQARETVKNYPVRGYYIDFLGLFTFGEWICPWCGERFRKDMGFDFKGIERMTHQQYVRYVQWHYAQYDGYAKKMRKVIEDARPGTVFVHNYHGSFDAPMLQNWKLAGENCSFISGDLFTLRKGTLAISWKLRGYAAASRMKPAESLLDSLTAVGGEFNTPKALDSYLAELWTCRSVNVAACTSIMLNIDGSFSPNVMALTRKVNQDLAPHEPWMKDMEPLATVGIVRSQQTMEHLPRDKEVYPEESHHSLDFEGWCQAAIQAHVLWDVVHDHLVTDENLSRFDVLILPSAACLSAKQCSAIRRYIRNGGRVIATGDTSAFDENGEPLDNFRLASAFGVKLQGARRADFDRVIIEAPSLKAKEPWVSDALAFSIGQWNVKASRKARVLGSIFNSSQVPMVSAYVPTGAPALTEYVSGKGRVLYMAGQPGLQYRVLGTENYRLLMDRVLKRVVGQRAPVTVEAPATVELFAHRQAGKDHLVVNLVQWVPGCSRSAGIFSHAVKTGARSQGLRFEENAKMPPAGDVAVRIKTPRGKRIKRVYLAPDRKPLKMKRDGNTVAVTVKNLQVHAMVVAEW